MSRSIQFAILLGLCFTWFDSGAAIGQQSLPVQPKQLRISDSSPLSKLSGKSTGVTPAAFLQTNQEKPNSLPGSKEKIPSILTGKKSTDRGSIVQSVSSDKETDDKIDPLNIPSSPITPPKTNNVPLNTGFQPQSGGFQAPQSKQFKATQSTNTPGAAGSAIGSTKQSTNSGFQTGSSAGGKVTLPSATATPRNFQVPKQNSLSPGSSSSGSTSNPMPRIQGSPRIQSPPPSFSGSTNSRDGQSKTNSVTSGSRTTNSGPSRSTVITPSRSEQTRSNVGQPNTRIQPPATTPRVADRSPTLPPVGSRVPPLTRPNDDIADVNNKTVSPSDLPLKPAGESTFTNLQLSPQLKVQSTGPKSISVNKSGQFEVKVMNVGKIDASDVIVGIEIPGWVEVTSKPESTGGEASVKNLGDAKGVVWNLSYLPSGREAVITMELEPKENRAFNLKTEWTTAPVSSEAKVMVTQAQLATRISGPGEVLYGAKAVYTITIENRGNGNAEQVDVALSESLGGDSASVGLIKAGDTKQFEVELTAGQAGPMKLEAMVKGDAGIRSAIAKEIVVRRANLNVKAIGPEFKYAGSALTYNISVENKGDAPAKNIDAAALLPLNAEYISGLNQIAKNDGRKISWKISEIPAGSRRDFIITCLIKQAGEARMEVGVRAEDGLTSGGIVKTRIEALADLKLEVVDPRGPQAVGRQVSYELHIKNRGTKSARNVLVSGEFSDFIDPVAGTGARATIQKAGVIEFAPIPEIKVGESVIIKVMAKATQPGTHTFRAIVQCKEQDIRKISEGTTKFFGTGTTEPKGDAKSEAAASSSTSSPRLAPPSTFNPPANKQ